MIDPVLQREYAFWRLVFREIQQPDLGARMALQLREFLRRPRIFPYPEPIRKEKA